MLDVFSAVLPVFLILCLGMILDRMRLLPESFAGHLSQYVFKVAMPFLLFRLVAGAELDFSSMGGFLAGLFLAEALIFVASYIWVKYCYRAGATKASILALSCACANSGFLGLPIIDSLLPGSRPALVAAGLACIMPPLVLAMAQSVIESHAGEGQQRGLAGIICRAVLLNPFVVVTILGMIVSVFAIHIWTPLGRMLDLVGSTGAPCALVSLGLGMWRKLGVARRSASPHRLAWQSGIVLFKLVLHPLLTWLLLALAGVEGVWLAVGVLMSGTSTAVMAYVLAEIHGVIPEECALSVVITAFLSMFSIPLFALGLKTCGYI